MQDTVTSALNKQGQYWQLNGANPKEDKNWKRKAEPADWFAKRIGRASKNVAKKKPVVQRDLEAVTAYGIQQYGRYFALWVSQFQHLSGASRREALQNDIVFWILVLGFLALLCSVQFSCVLLLAFLLVPPLPPPPPVSGHRIEIRIDEGFWVFGSASAR